MAEKTVSAEKGSAYSAVPTWHARQPNPVSMVCAPTRDVDLSVARKKTKFVLIISASVIPAMTHSVERAKSVTAVIVYRIHVQALPVPGTNGVW